MYMHRFTLVGLTLLAVFAFAAVAASAASAEAPLILVLPGETIIGLAFSGSGGASKLETLTKKTITCTKTEVTATFNQISGKESDSETGSATIDFSGCKKEKIACRSEEGATKDPVEVVLTPLTLAGASEESQSKTLEALLVGTIAPVGGVLFLNCGGVKEEIKGSVGCLASPALMELVAGTTVTISCAESGGDQVMGLKCVETKATCEKLAKEPLMANLGLGFEDSAEEISVAGTFNKMVTIDD
jgi:hypothetical protein